MFEVVISNVQTGRVWRKSFGTSAEADRHMDRFFDGGSSWPRERRNYRVEVFHRPRPVARTVTQAADEAA